MYARGDADHAYYSVLAPQSLRNSFLEEEDWSVRIGWGLPGTTNYHDDPPGSSYHRFGNHEGWEPIVILPDSHDGRDSETLINQEFVLTFRLFEDKKSGNYLSVAEDGSEEVVIERSVDRVRVRSSYLARYRALRQMDLWIFIDAVGRHPSIGGARDFSEFEDHWRTDSSCGRAAAGHRFNQTTSHFTAKKFLPPGPIESCRLWQFDTKTESYSEFLIGEDELGQPISFTCEEAKLANYFGKNPEAPHYLTPVFFRSDVLKKYYENPDRYAVSEGSVRCAGSWYLRLDNDHLEYVAVFLGDLGRDLPATERTYWKSYNIVPIGPMSDSYFRRSINGEWVDATRADHRFRHAYEEARSIWKDNHGWSLHREPHNLDAQLIATLHTPLNDGQTEFEEQLLGLAKVLVDFLDVKQLKSLVGSEKENEPSLPKLRRFLTSLGYEYVEQDITFLRNVQELRSKAVAHSKGSSYDEYITKKLGPRSRKLFIVDQFNEAAEMMQRWSELASAYSSSTWAESAS